MSPCLFKRQRHPVATPSCTNSRGRGEEQQLCSDDHKTHGGRTEAETFTTSDSLTANRAGGRGENCANDSGESWTRSQLYFLCLCTDTVTGFTFRPSGVQKMSDCAEEEGNTEETPGSEDSDPSKDDPSFTYEPAAQGKRPATNFLSLL